MFKWWNILQWHLGGWGRDSTSQKGWGGRWKGSEETEAKTNGGRWGFVPICFREVGDFPKQKWRIKKNFFEKKTSLGKVGGGAGDGGCGGSSPGALCIYPRWWRWVGLLGSRYARHSPSEAWRRGQISSLTFDLGGRRGRLSRSSWRLHLTPTPVGLSSFKSRVIEWSNNYSGNWSKIW